MDPGKRRSLRSRRQALEFLLGGVGIVFVSSCTQGTSSEPIVLDSYYDSGDGRQAMLDAVTSTSLAAMVRIGTTNRDTFTTSIAGYLASRPGSVFTWSAGSGLAELIRNGRVEQVSKAWNSSDLNPRLRRLSSDAAGVQYMVPLWFDPIGFFYSRAAWADAGYSAPSTPEELVELSQTMAGNGVAAFGMSRLATSALISLFDYVAIATHGVEAYRRSITEPGFELSNLSAEVLPVIQRLTDIEVVLEASAPVSIVPASLSEASARSGSGDDLDCFVLGSESVVAQCEGLMLAQSPEGEDQSRSKQLLAELADIKAQQAFLGSDSALLPANLNANYQTMDGTMLHMVEIIDRSRDIVESTEAAPPSVLAELTTQLTTIVRP